MNQMCSMLSMRKDTLLVQWQKNTLDTISYWIVVFVINLSITITWKLSWTTASLVVVNRINDPITEEDCFGVDAELIIGCCRSYWRSNRGRGLFWCRRRVCKAWRIRCPKRRRRPPWICRRVSSLQDRRNRLNANRNINEVRQSIDRSVNQEQEEHQIN